MSASQNLDLEFARTTRRRLGRQTIFCDPQIPRYSAVLETGFPANQQRQEVLRGTQCPGLKPPVLIMTDVFFVMQAIVRMKQGNCTSKIIDERFEECVAPS